MTNRIPLVTVLAFLVTIGFLVRIGTLQLVQKDKFDQLAAKQLQKIITLPAVRGGIYDRNGIPLALSESVYSAYATPLKIENSATWAQKVSWYLPDKTYQLLDKLSTNSPFVWIRRQLSEYQYEKLKALELPGLGFLRDEKRRYPHERLAGQIIGFVGIDNQGLSGLEYQFDAQLRGQPGKLLLEGGPRGFHIASGEKQVIRAAHDGNNLVLTIDASIQYATEKYLAEGVARTEALSGQAIVMDPQTGEVLAMATVPAFNPNNWQSSPVWAQRNRLVTDVYEPGSVFKMVTIASVLEEELVRPDTVITVPKTLDIADKTVKEAHKRKEGESDQKSVTEILQDSLNVGTTLLAQELGADKFHRYIRLFGFGRRSGIGLPGETAGIVREPASWSGVDIATFSYGQGIGVSTLQMATAACAVVNGGMLIAPSIVQHMSNADGTTQKKPTAVRKQRVLSRQTSQEMVDMLVNVVDNGTGHRVRIKGFGVGGKTGTAQKPGPNGGYLKGQYIASFLGFFPASEPRAVVLVAIDSPKTSIWGSTVAGPVVKDISLAVIDALGLAPDRL